MRLCLLALLSIVCYCASAQRVYYQAGFPPAPGRHLFLANRQRTRLANGFSARLQQTTDETDEQDSTTGTNTAGGIGVVTGSGDAEQNDNSLDDMGTTGGGDSQTPGSTKSPTSTTSGGSTDSGDDSGETIDDQGATEEGSTTESTSGDAATTDSSAEDIGGETSTSSSGDDSSEDGGVDNRSSSGGSKNGGGKSNAPGGNSKGGHGDDGSYDHGDHGDTIEWLKDSVQGEPGKDYPIYSEIPQTSFKCSDQKLPGYYGDVEAKCQVFHICQADGRMDSFLCPNGTIFAQNYFVCVWWHDFDCSTTESFYNLNENLYKPGKGIDGSDVIISPLDMMNGIMPMVLGSSGNQDSDSGSDMGGNTIDGSSNDAIDESIEGDKVNSKTNTNDMGFTADNAGPMNNFSPSSNPMTKSNNGSKGNGKTNPSKTNGNGKTNQSPVNGMKTMLMMMGKTNGNGNTKTPITSRTPLTTTSAPIDDTTEDQSDNEINEPASTETPSNVSERPTGDDSSPTTDSGEGDSNDNMDNNISNAPEDDSQRNIEENEMPNERRAQTTTNLPSDNSITENPAAEEVTDTPIEGGTTSEEETTGKDETSTDETPNDQQDVQITEKDDGTSSAVRSRARFLLYRPRSRSAQLARVRVNPKRARFLPVLSSRNGVTRRLVSNSSNNRKRSKRLRTNSRRNSVRRKSSRSSSPSRRSGKRSSQLRLKKKSNRNSKKVTSPKKKNPKRANNRRKQSRSNSRSNSNNRRRGGSRRSRSQRRTNRRLVVLRNSSVRKHQN